MQDPRWTAPIRINCRLEVRAPLVNRHIKGREPASWPADFITDDERLPDGGMIRKNSPDGYSRQDRSCEEPGAQTNDDQYEQHPE